MSGICRSLFIVLLFSGFSILGCSDSSDNSVAQNVNDMIVAEAEVAATEVLERHMLGRNKSDAVAISEEDNYPQIRLSGGTVQRTETADVTILIEERVVMPVLEASGWDHSEWDEITILQSSENKVHFQLLFSRVDALGDKYLTSPTFWAVTNQAGHWGIKFRSSFVDESGGGGDVAEAEAAAINTLERHLEARNNRDTDGLAAVKSYPLTYLSDAELNYFETIDDYVLYEETIVIPELDYSEWDHSEWENLKVIQSTQNMVHIIVKLNQFDVTGNKYLEQDQFWAVANVEGGWKIQALSNFVDAIQRN